MGVIILCIIGALDILIAILDFKTDHYFLGVTMICCAIFMALSIYNLVG